VAGRRALVVGDKGAGKTTLLLRLLHDGHRVEGDELVLFRSRAAVCLPRNFHVKPGTPALIPELAAHWDQLPATTMSDGTVITAFDPSAAGFDWRVDLAPVDVVFVLRPDHGGTASCRALGALELARAVLARAFPTPLPARDLLRACSALVEGTDGYELTVGEVQATADLLVHSCRDAPTPRC